MNQEFDEIKSLINSQYSNYIQNKNINDDFVDAVALRVAELMETKMELFFNHLYRMDVNEMSIHRVLNSNSEESVYISIAKIIIERQRKRLETKRKYKQDKIDGWDDF